MKTLLLLAAVSLSAAEPPDRFEQDAASVLRFRSGLGKAVEWARANPSLFPAEKLEEPRMLSREQRDAARGVWKSLLDYVLALDAVGAGHKSFWTQPGGTRRKSLLVSSAAFLAGYRQALDFLALAENDPGLHKLFDEAVPELGLPAGSYSRFKFRFLNVARGAEFAAVRAVLKGASPEGMDALRSAVEADSEALWAHGKGQGEILTVKNGLKILEQGAFTAWFPVQAGVSEWMGDTKVYRKTRNLVTDAQAGAMAARLQPGDILLERREWFLSNIGLPGYWPHAALYIGTPEERSAYFKEEVPGFEAELSSKAAGAYERSLGGEHGHPFRVLEAISEGVSFTTIEHSGAADAVAALRPRLSKKEKAEALLRAFRYQGRPYDFDFDFTTDAALVCTELVFKAYEPTSAFRGLRFPLEQMMGRWVLPANKIAVLFDQEAAGKEPQLDFVFFLDGRETSPEAAEADVAAFRTSWTRPKWHIMFQ